MKHRASERAIRFRARHGSRLPRRTASQLSFMSVAAVVGFGLVFAQTTVTQIENSFNVRDITDIAPVAEPEVTPDPNDPLAGQDINILLIGSDVRDGENKSIGGYVGGMRGDATVIMHISADRSRIEMLSIPRDLRVRIPDCELFDGTVVRGWTGKFNIAFANGGREGDPAEGAACAMRTVTELTGVNFDHYAVMDFAGFRDMIDSLDGVPMCVAQDINSPKAKLTLEAGPQVLDGTTALAYARARTGTGLGDGSDPSRIGRQQELMENTMRKALGMNLLTDTSKLTQFVRSVAEALTLDPQLGSVAYVSGLGFSLQNLNPDNIVFATVPWGSAGDGSGDIVARPGTQDLYDALATDTPMLPDELVEVTEPSPEPSEEPVPLHLRIKQGEPTPEPEPERTPEPDVDAQLLDAGS